MHEFIAAVPNADNSFDIFKGDAFFPIRGALEGCDGLFFKYVNRGTYVNQVPEIPPGGEDPVYEFTASVMGNPDQKLFYARTQNDKLTLSEVKYKVFEVKNGYKIKNKRGDVLEHIKISKRKNDWYVNAQKKDVSVHDSEQEAKTYAMINAYRRLLKRERRG